MKSKAFFVLVSLYWSENPAFTWLKLVHNYCGASAEVEMGTLFGFYKVTCYCAFWSSWKQKLVLSFSRINGYACLGWCGNQSALDGILFFCIDHYRHALVVNIDLGWGSLKNGVQLKGFPDTIPSSIRKAEESLAHDAAQTFKTDCDLNWHSNLCI